MGCQLSHHSKSISYRNSPINKAKSCPTLSKILLGGQKVQSNQSTSVVLTHQHLRELLFSLIGLQEKPHSKLDTYRENETVSHTLWDTEP
ncbi:hypothetical protein FLL83_08590 [Vibrio cholerae]|nr:hypothetical protein [Vibrio cholerae]EGR4187695.1 hypothetical protein [Vibrio cholerae]EGR4198922.1 hypothetical protein [Vibrio cholerae]KAA1213534.1 hypothetical protein F0Q05_15930 [Vibrio cholerae]KAA1219241.1 hypothetical protein F0P99_10155 [Vibrio cholerae]